MGKENKKTIRNTKEWGGENLEAASSKYCGDYEAAPSSS
jgi:hypothetical protein